MRGEKNTFVTSSSTDTNIQYVQNKEEINIKDLSSLKLIKVFSSIAIVLALLSIVVNLYKYFVNPTMIFLQTNFFLVVAAVFAIISFVLSKKRGRQFNSNPEIYSDNSKKIIKLKKLAFIAFILVVLAYLVLIILEIIPNITETYKVIDDVDNWNNGY